MPQLDFIIVFPQIFWLLLTFFFTYTTIICFFLPLFVKFLKTRKHIVIENTKLLLLTQKKIDTKQLQLSTTINQNFYLVKLFLETEIINLFSKDLALELNSIDTKVIEVLYYNTIYYDTNILDSIPLNPKFNKKI
nr:ATP synthase F0 subunit 8 [Phymatolithon calcareum]